MLISESEDRERQLENQLEDKQTMLQQLQEKTEELNNLILKYIHRKESKMVEILTLQTRAKWYVLAHLNSVKKHTFEFCGFFRYRSVKAKKYKMSVENDDMALNEIVALRDQNTEIRKILHSLNENYPFYKRNLQKAVVLLAD